eukprot:615221-Rhodomonas_salina.3
MRYQLPKRALVVKHGEHALMWATARGVRASWKRCALHGCTGTRISHMIAATFHAPVRVRGSGEVCRANT